MCHLSSYGGAPCPIQAGHDKFSVTSNLSTHAESENAACPNETLVWDNWFISMPFNMSTSGSTGGCEFGAGPQFFVQ